MKNITIEPSDEITVTFPQEEYKVMGKTIIVPSKEAKIQKGEAITCKSGLGWEYTVTRSAKGMPYAEKTTEL